MKKITKILLGAAMLLPWGVPNFALAAEAQPAEAGTEMLCGGWTVQEEIDADARRTFAKGAKQVSQYRLTPISCSTQVVAGLNYCFLCVARPGQGPTAGRSAYAALNLYEDLSGNVEVTGFRLIPLQVP